MTGGVTETRLWAVLPAAGRGTRFGGSLPKQYQPLGDRCVLVHSLERVLQPPAVRGAVIVRSTMDQVGETLEFASSKPVRWTTTVGPERMDSVRDGVLAAAAQGATHVLVHDAARPLVDSRDVENLIRVALTDESGGLLAMPVRDALKQSAEGRVVGQVSRAHLWQAQTPQLFAVDLLLTALAAATAAGRVVADEAEAVVALGVAPQLVRGSSTNFKVTYAEDLALAQWVLAAQQAAVNGENGHGIA